MAKQVKRRRGTTSEHSTFTGAEAEITIDTDKETAVIHDGATAGGFPLMREDGDNNGQASTFRTNIGLTDGNADLDLNGLTTRKSVNFYNVNETDRRLTINQALSTVPRLYYYDEGDDAYHDFVIGGTSSDSDGVKFLADGQMHVFDKDKGIIIGSDTRSPRLGSERSASPGGLTVMPSGGDHPGSVEIFPAGTSQRSHFIASNNDDPANMQFVKFEARIDSGNNEGLIRAAAKGTGTAPTRFKWENFPDGVLFENIDIQAKQFKANNSGLWSDATLTDNFINANNTGNDTGFAIGGGTTVSTWFGYDGTNLNRAVDVWNDGTDIQIGRDYPKATVKSNLFVDGGLFAEEFVIEQTKLFSEQMFGPMGGKIETVSDATVGSEKIVFSSEHGAGIPVSAGAVIRIQSRTGLNSGTIIKHIERKVDSINPDGDNTMEALLTDTGITWTAGTANDDVGSIEEGDHAVGVGHTTDSTLDHFIHFDVAGVDIPAIRLWDSVADVNGGTEFMRIGGLDSFQFFGSQDIGIGIGTAHYLQANANSGAGEVSLSNGVLKANGGAGTVDLATFTVNSQYLNQNNIYIGNNLTTQNAVNTLLVGNYQDGSIPLVKALGPTDTTYVQMSARNTTTEDFFRISVKNDFVVSVTEDEAKFFGITVDNSGLFNGSSRSTSDFQIDATDGFIIEANDAFGAQRAFTIENDGDIVGGIWGDGTTVFVESRNGKNIQLFGDQSAKMLSGNLFVDVNQNNVTIKTSTGEMVITELPTSEPTGPDRLFTQTASELGGSGTTKVLCVSSGSAPSTPSQPSVCKQSNALIISWDSVDGADTYDVQRSVGGGTFTDWKTDITGTEVNDLDPASQPDTTYEYQVRACNSQGCSAYSTSSSSTTFNTASSC